MFILYLAYAAFRSWRNFNGRGVELHSSSRQSVIKAAIVNALSPGPYIYWSLVTGPILVTGWREAPRHGLGFLVSFYAVIVFTLGGIVLVFGTARRLGPKVNQALLGASTIALFAFGLYQLWVGAVGRRAEALW